MDTISKQRYSDNKRLKRLLRNTGRAISDFNMIDEGDRVMVCLSGGKDSSALAIFMKDNYPELDIEYFFTDTGEELAEVYEYKITLKDILESQ